MNLSESYKKRLQELSGIKTDNSQYGFDVLSQKLLSIGGNRVVETYEEDLDKLLKRGQDFKGVKSQKVKMNDSKCHQNSACFWGNYSDEHGTDAVKIVTGWALTKSDGLWRQHTWVFLPDKNLIVETTIKRDMYFGYVLTDEEANEFYSRNW